MKNLFSLLIISTTLLACREEKIECRKYPLNDAETCTPTYQLLQNREWVLDSVFLNGQNITAQSLAQAKDFKIVITDKNIKLSSNYWPRQVLYSELHFNDSVFKYRYISEYGNVEYHIGLSPLADDIKSSIANKQRPLVLGLNGPLDYDNSSVEFCGIQKLQNNILIFRLMTKDRDTIIYNYFHSN